MWVSIGSEETRMLFQVGQVADSQPGTTLPSGRCRTTCGQQRNSRPGFKECVTSYHLSLHTFSTRRRCEHRTCSLTTCLWGCWSRIYLRQSTGLSWSRTASWLATLICRRNMPPKNWRRSGREASVCCFTYPSQSLSGNGTKQTIASQGGRASSTWLLLLYRHISQTRCIGCIFRFYHVYHIYHIRYISYTFYICDAFLVYHIYHTCYIYNIWFIYNVCCIPYIGYTSSIYTDLNSERCQNNIILALTK